MNYKIPRFDISMEYQTLREELLQGKRYVFERPLLIVTVCIAALNFVERPYLYLLPFVVVSLLLFNFWFTVNRLRSIARIAAYIQVVLENEPETAWVGWESFLRYYRKWMKRRTSEEVEKVVAEKIDKEAIPAAMMYYPPIFGFHLGVVNFCVISSVGNAWTSHSIISVVSTVITISSGVVFIRYGYVFRPSKMRILIERERVICQEVQKDMSDSD